MNEYGDGAPQVSRVLPPREQEGRAARRHHVVGPGQGHAEGLLEPAGQQRARAPVGEDEGGSALESPAEAAEEAGEEMRGQEAEGEGGEEGEEEAERQAGRAAEAAPLVVGGGRGRGGEGAGHALAAAAGDGLSQWKEGMSRVGPIDSSTMSDRSMPVTVLPTSVPCAHSFQRRSVALRARQ